MRHPNGLGQKPWHLLKLLMTHPCYAHAGIDDPYEVPESPEIALNVNDAQGGRQSPEAMARIVLTYLEV